MYDGYAYSSSASTTNAAAAVSAKVNIGTSTLSGIARDSKSHIAGINYPMYGIKNNVPKDKTPKFKMSHLYALVALEIVNVGDGKADNDDQPITVNSVTFTAPDNIIGDFNVNVTNDKHTFSDAGSNSKTISLTALKDTEGETGITIDPRESATLYFAIKPYDASGKELKISINGSEKTVKMPANTKFEEGKITTLKVPIKLSHPKESDALSFITFDSKSKRKEIIINGEKINAYVLHETSSWGKKYGQTLVIKGNVKQLFNLLDAGFYASTWDGKPSAMTVSNINIWISGTQFIKYDPLMTALRANLAEQPGLGQLIASLWNIPFVGVKALLSSMFEDGIARDGEIALTKFIDPSTITFTGLVSNGATNENPNTLLLDDGQIHKLVGKDNIENLLATKFDYTTPLGEKLVPSYSGLLEIINRSQEGSYSPEAQKTIRAIYGKLKNTLGSYGGFDFAGISIKAWDIFEALFPSEEAMMTMLPTLDISVTIEVYPYSSKTGAYGKKGAPEKPEVALQPIILWGFDTNTTVNPTGI